MDKHYVTKDLGEAIALVTLECKMIDTMWKDGIAYFTFTNPEQCQKLSQEYFFGNLEVPARAYYDNLRMLKRKIFNKNSR